MLVSEQELAIQVAEVDRIQVDDVNLAKAREDQILEELASDASSADHQDLRLENDKMSGHMAQLVNWYVLA